MGMAKLFRLIFLFYWTGLIGWAHPLNVTKMELNLTGKKEELKGTNWKREKKSSGHFWLRFASFNLIKPLHMSENPDDKEAYARAREIEKYTTSHLKIIRGGKECRLIPTDFRVNNLIVIDQTFNLYCPGTGPDLKIKFDLFFKEDPTQTGVMRLITSKGEKTLIFSPSKSEYLLTIGSPTTTLQFFIKEGVLHIWEGTDHLTFLFLLIIPALLLSPLFKPNLLELLKIATAFTISHSVTLSLSVFNILSPYPPLIEVAIAVTILLTAFNNLFHLIPFKWEWLLGFLFGFIHGFGFANALKGLNLATTDFAKVVFGFNFGVEIGQGIIIGAIFPLLWLLRKHWEKGYRLLFTGATIGGGGMAIYWIWERIPPLLNYLQGG